MHSDSNPKGDLVKLQRGLMSEAEARSMLERIRFPNGLHCIFPDCGGAEVYRIEVAGKVYTKKDGSERIVHPRHLFKCKACKRQFSVTKGTIFEDSKIPLTVWITVMYRMCSSKKGVSAYQIHREYGLTYEAAWFMCHRIRWAMTEKNPDLLTGVLEADETYYGGKLRGHPKHRQTDQTMRDSVTAAMEKRTQIVGVLERGGRVRATSLNARGQRITRGQVEGFLLDHVDTNNALLFTDEYAYYDNMSKRLPHGIIKHKSEYVRGVVHTNGIEGFWSGLKKQLEATHHHVDAGYLNMYVQESAYRHSTREIKDVERFTALLGQVEGRLDWYVGKLAKGASE